MGISVSLLSFQVSPSAQTCGEKRLTPGPVVSETAKQVKPGGKRRGGGSVGPKSSETPTKLHGVCLFLCFQCLVQ